MIKVIKVINQRGKKTRDSSPAFFQPLKGLDEIVVARGLNKKMVRIKSPDLHEKVQTRHETKIQWTGNLEMR